MDTKKSDRVYLHCPQCGQPIRSSERLRNHLNRCLATGRWRNARKGGAS